MFNRTLAIFLSAAALFACTAAAQAGPPLFVDHFNGGMSNAWSIVRPNSSYYSFQPGYLDLRANSGDLWLSENNALNVFLVQNPTAGDFMVTLGLNSFTPTSISNAPQIALLAYDSDNAYVRDDFGSHDFYWPAQLALEFAYETPSPNTYNPVISDIDFGTNPFWLRLQKIGNVYTQYYSTDGTNFVQTNGSITYGNGVPAELGFVAMSDPMQSSHAYINTFEIDSVPEPGALALLGVGVVALAGRRSKRVALRKDADADSRP
jgi:hypothetical protein